MAKNTQKKQNIIQNYKSLLENSSAVFFFSGSLNATHTQTVKKNITDDAKLTLLKNTLFNIAAKEYGVEVTAHGYNNAIFVEKDIVSNASMLNKFLGENELSANTVLVGKSIYSGAKLKDLSSLGSKEQVYTKLVSVLAMPSTLLVRSLNSPLQKLAFVISQIQK